MALMRTKTIYAFVALAAGCLNLKGQPAAESLATAAPSIAALSTSSSAWTVQHTMIVIGALAVIAGLALLWVLLLRRKVAEQIGIWQQSEAKFRSLVEQSLVGVYVLQDGRFVYVNPRMANIFGYSMEELISAKVTLQQLIHEEDWPTVEKQIQRRMSGEIASAQMLHTGPPLGQMRPTNRRPAICQMLKAPLPSPDAR